MAVGIGLDDGHDGHSASGGGSHTPVIAHNLVAGDQDIGSVGEHGHSSIIDAGALPCGQGGLPSNSPEQLLVFGHNRVPGVVLAHTISGSLAESVPLLLAHSEDTLDFVRQVVFAEWDPGIAR